MKELVLQGAVGGLTGGFEDRTVTAEQPAVIAAADACFADEAEFERRAAMRAMQLEEADLTAAVAERDQVLTKNFELQRQVLQIVGIADRLPEAA
jgi:hypothetical protein